MTEYSTIGTANSETHLSGITHDTDQSTLETAAIMEALFESERRFRSVAQSAVDAIISTDDHDTITFWNKGAERIFGYTEAEMTGKPVTTIIPEEYRSAHSQGVKRFLRTGVPALIGRCVELQGLRKNGKKFPLELSLSTWKTRQGTFFTGIIRDVSNRKETEKALQNSTEEAKQRSEELASLVQMVAHDLKSPVITITGLVRRLKKLLETDGSKENIGLILNQLLSAGDNMERFLADLLDGLVMQHVPPDFEELDFLEVLNKVVLQHKESLKERKIQFLMEIPEGAIKISGDKRRLSQVFDNLISNAIKHMGICEEPTIKVRIIQSADLLTTSVIDNGIGIQPEFQAKIFERFFRVKREKGACGTGLGLAITKQIVESHGGKIWVESTPGQGTIFSFEIPRNPAGNNNENGPSA